MTYLPSYSGIERLVGSYRTMPAMHTTPLPLYTLETKMQVYDAGTSNHSAQHPSALSEIPTAPKSPYTQQASASYLMPHKREYFSPEPFLNPSRPAAQWIGEAAQVQHYVEALFEHVTGGRLPQDVVIEVVPEEQLFAAHNALSGAASPGLQGFSLNRHGFGSSDIFVKQNALDKLLLTIGHEIGHVLSFSLPNTIAEEAKAFAFELAWMEAIVERNVAGLAQSINLHPNPAQNGLHDVAWQWVERWRNAGMEGKEIFRQLALRQLEVEG